MFSSDSKGAIISQWLHNGDASWRALVRALSSPFVGKRSLARRIAAKHPKCEEHVRYSGATMLFYQVLLCFLTYCMVGNFRGFI